MKKNVVWLIVLALLPILTVGLECMPDSVMVYDGAAVSYYSYFDLMPESIPNRLLMPLTGLMTAVAFVITVIYVISRKDFWLKGLKWVSLITACVAVLPVVIRTEIFVVPSVFAPILLCLEALLCQIYLKRVAGKAEEKPVGRRLK